MVNLIRILVASLVIAAFAASAQAQLDSWAAKTPCADSISAGGLAASGGYFYQYGGWTYSGGIARSWRFDPSTASWSPRAPMPTLNWYFPTASYSRFCFAFGDVTGYGTQIYRYNTAIDQWTTLAATLSAGRINGAAAVVGTKIYICGGIGMTGFSNVVDELDLLTGLVTPRAALPVPTRGAIAATVGTRLFYMGGGSATGYDSAVHEYDTVNDQWTPRATMTQARCWAASFVLNSRIFAAGGMNSTGRLATVHEYHPAADEWTSRTALPFARSHLGGCAISTKGYVFGGQTTVMLPDCLEYTPPDYGTPPADPTALYMQVPGGSPLAEGAWTSSTAMEFGATFTDADPGDTLRIEVEAGTYSGTGPTSVTLTGMTEGSYTWRCRARDAIGNVNPAGWITFGTAAVDFQIDLTPPPVTTGLYPINVDLWATTAAGAVVDFGWTAVTDNGPSVTYELEISLNSAFTPLVVSASNLTGTTTQITLPINVGHGAYFWRIRAVDLVGNASTSWGITNAFHLWYEDGIDHGAGDRLCNSAAGPAFSSPLLLLALVLMIGLKVLLKSRS